MARTGRFQIEFVPTGEDMDYAPVVDAELAKRRNILEFCREVKKNVDVLLGAGREEADLPVPPREFEFEEEEEDVVLEERIRAGLEQALGRFDLDAEEAERLRPALSTELEPFYPEGHAVKFGLETHPSSEVRFYCSDWQGNIRCYGQYLLTLNDRTAMASATALDGQASLVVQWQFDMFATGDDGDD